MLTGILYSACGSASSNRAIGVDSNGNLALYPAGIPAPDNVTWYLGQGFGANGAPLGFFFQNKQTGGYLYGNGDGQLAVGNVALDGWSTWTIGGSLDSPYVAVRPLADDDLNINILGGCDGTTIGLWRWGGGDPNEIWAFGLDQTAPPRPSYYNVYAGCGGYLSVDPSTGRVFYDGTRVETETLGGQLDGTVWDVEPAMGTARNGVPVPLNGMAIISAIRNTALKANGYGQSVSLVGRGQIDQNSTWTAGGDGSATVALRPFSDDDQNLNVSGGCGGTDVITYWWGGGDPNEIWQFVATSPASAEEAPRQETSQDAPHDGPSLPEVW